MNKTIKDNYYIPYVDKEHFSMVVASDQDLYFVQFDSYCRATVKKYILAPDETPLTNQQLLVE